MEEKEHIVDFEKYCKTCSHEKRPEDEYPCFVCLSIPARMNSRKPEKWEEKHERTTKQRSVKNN